MPQGAGHLPSLGCRWYSVVRVKHPCRRCYEGTAMPLFLSPRTLSFCILRNAYIRSTQYLKLGTVDHRNVQSHRRRVWIWRAGRYRSQPPRGSYQHESCLIPKPRSTDPIILPPLPGCSKIAGQPGGAVPKPSSASPQIVARAVTHRWQLSNNHGNISRRIANMTCR